MMGRVDAIIDGGECDIGLESTIVKIEDEDTVTLLRPGAITYDALCMVVANVKVAAAVSERLGENERPLSPGMKYRHYAPTAPLVLLSGKDEDVLAFVKAETRKCAALCYDEECEALAGRVLFPIGKKDDLGAQARRLFAALREADGTDAEIIYAHLPPQDGLGLALYNRLIRAAAHTVKEV
jgi:L-threonylcarbamoyladenylate synthase